MFLSYLKNFEVHNSLKILFKCLKNSKIESKLKNYCLKDKIKKKIINKYFRLVDLYLVFDIQKISLLQISRIENQY